MILIWKRIAGGNLRMWQMSNRGKIREFFLFLLFLVILYSHHDILLQREIERRYKAELLVKDQEAFRELPTVTFIIEANSPSGLYRKLSDIAGDIDKHRIDLLNIMRPEKPKK